MNKKYIPDNSLIELTDLVIKKIVSEKKWADVRTLKQMADLGAMWSKSKNTITFTR